MVPYEPLNVQKILVLADSSHFDLSCCYGKIPRI